MSQKKAGDLWLGIRAFSRYERGETRQGMALDKLLRLLDRHPKLAGRDPCEGCGIEMGLVKRE